MKILRLEAENFTGQPAGPGCRAPKEDDADDDFDGDEDLEEEFEVPDLPPAGLADYERLEDAVRPLAKARGAKLSHEMKRIREAMRKTGAATPRSTTVVGSYKPKALPAASHR